MISFFKASNPFTAFAVFPFFSAANISLFSVLVAFLKNHLSMYDINCAFSFPKTMLDIYINLPLNLIFQDLFLNFGLLLSPITAPSSKSSNNPSSSSSKFVDPLKVVTGITFTKSLALLRVLFNSLISVFTSSGIK